jgi:DNA mismatch repair protein MLH1
MLHEYFSIKFEWKTNHLEATHKKLILTGLPIILRGHSPSPHALPMFLLRLATQVDWIEERKCFTGICTELGNYYAEISEDPEYNESLGLNQRERKVIQHIVFPAFRYYLIPPKEFASDGNFSKLALLSKLYKVFERC